MADLKIIYFDDEHYPMPMVLIGGVDVTEHIWGMELVGKHDDTLCRVVLELDIPVRLERIGALPEQ